MIENLTLNEVEKIVLDNTKFMDFVLEEVRKRNALLQGELKMTYGKLIGLGTPYEELIHIARQVKGEFDNYLKIVRDQFAAQSKKEKIAIRKSQRGRPIRQRPTTS